MNRSIISAEALSITVCYYPGLMLGQLKKQHKLFPVSTVSMARVGWDEQLHPCPSFVNLLQRENGRTLILQKRLVFIAMV